MGFAQSTTGHYSAIDLKVAQYFPESKLKELYQSLDNDPEFYGRVLRLLAIRTSLLIFLLTH